MLSCSDDFFEPCTNLIKSSPSESRKGQFGPNGARYDGWESRCVSLRLQCHALTLGQKA